MSVRVPHTLYGARVLDVRVWIRRFGSCILCRLPTNEAPFWQLRRSDGLFRYPIFHRRPKIRRCPVLFHFVVSGGPQCWMAMKNAGQPKKFIGLTQASPQAPRAPPSLITMLRSQDRFFGTLQDVNQPVGTVFPGVVKSRGSEKCQASVTTIKHSLNIFAQSLAHLPLPCG